MKTTPVTREDLGRSVLAVPPLARDAGLAPDRAANQALVRHMEAGGVSTLLYGGNANFYNIGLYEYGGLLDLLAEIAAPESWVIPSVGPDYGKMMDQAPLVRDRGFPTAMVLPLSFPATPAGTETGLRRCADALGRPVILYVKAAGAVDPAGVRRLADDGVICAVKYGVVHDDPGRDPFLARLVDAVEPGMIVSGIGERPAIAHLRAFGLAGFTSGAVCLAPTASMRLLRALRAGDVATAEAVREHFLPFEDQRDAISPLRVLHDAVTLAGIADMGPMLPLLSGLMDTERARVAGPARALLAWDRGEASREEDARRSA